MATAIFDIGTSGLYVKAQSAFDGGPISYTVAMPGQSIGPFTEQEFLKLMRYGSTSGGDGNYWGAFFEIDGSKLTSPELNSPFLDAFAALMNNRETIVNDARQALAAPPSNQPEPVTSEPDEQIDDDEDNLEINNGDSLFGDDDPEFQLDDDEDEFLEGDLLTEPEDITDEEFNQEFDEEFGDEEFSDDLGDDAPSNVPPNEILVMGDRYLDWRVKLSLAPGSNYLYNAKDARGNLLDAGILTPLRETGGVIFPYTPQINIIYTASYEASSIVHTNYKVHQYSNSSVDSITLTCDFTAQDTREAIYLLSVIHFFRSVTKMFYGQDQNPRAGTPPPLCYIRGMGSYQFASHPIAITNFTYNLPQDVDYIEVSGPALAGLTLPANPVSNLRLPPGVLPGGGPTPPNFATNSSVDQLLPITRVPTKMQIQLSAIPVISRGDMAENFSLEQYASGSIYTTGQFW